MPAPLVEALSIRQTARRLVLSPRTVERHLANVIREVRRYSSDVVVVNDGSTDRTGELLAQFGDIHVITHPRNRGYGAALISAFDYAIAQQVEVLVTNISWVGAQWNDVVSFVVLVLILLVRPTGILGEKLGRAA